MSIPEGVFEVVFELIGELVAAGVDARLAPKLEARRRRRYAAIDAKTLGAMSLAELLVAARRRFSGLDFYRAHESHVLATEDDLDARGLHTYLVALVANERVQRARLGLPTAGLDARIEQTGLGRAIEEVARRAR